MFGFIEVVEDKGSVHIKGVVAQDLLQDISKAWKTSKVGANVFCNIGFGGRALSFPKFYTIEVLYILERLMKETRNRVPRRILTKIYDELRLNSSVVTNINLPVKKRFDYSRLKHIDLEMLPHQREFIELYEDRTQRYNVDGYLLAAAPGSGKTLNCIGLHEVSKNDVFIAVCPLNALERVWDKTMRENLIGNRDKPDNVWVSKTLGELAPESCGYYAFHYDALDRAVILARKLAAAGKTVTIALDECHNINNPKSMRAQYFESLCKITKSKDVIWSSGTPIKAIGSECIVMLRTITTDFTPECEAGFRKIFGKDGGKANDILAHRIGLISFKVDKSAIVKGEVVVNEVKVKIPNGDDYTLDKIRDDMSRFIVERTKYYNTQMPEIKKFYELCLDLHVKTLHGDQQMNAFKEYQRAVKTISSGYDPRTMVHEAMIANKYELNNIIPTLPKDKKNDFKSVRSAIKYVKLKIMGEALGGILGKARTACHVDMLEYIDFENYIDNAQKKTIVFTSYVEVVKETNRMLGDKGYKGMMVYGDTNSQLNTMIKQFGEDESINPVIATYQSLSTAVPMIMANTIINVNQPFREIEREQSISRCNRLGQDATVYVYDFMLDTGIKGNVSTRSKDILEWSKAMVESIMGIQTPSNLEASLESMAADPSWAERTQEDFVGWVRTEYGVFNE